MKSVSPRLKVSFLIDSTLLGGFVHAYADKVQGLEIGAVVGVPFNKNSSVFAANRNESVEIGKQLRAAILVFMQSCPQKRATRNGIIAQFPKYPGKLVRQLLYRMVYEGDLIKTKKLGEVALGAVKAKAANAPTPKPKPKKVRPPGGYNFEKPEIREKATRNALKAQGKAVSRDFVLGKEQKQAAGRRAADNAKKRGIDFAALGRKGNEAKLRKREAAKNGNGVHPPATAPSAPASGD